MVVDIRYHLASLVAVFFALGLGILVGMSLASGGQGRELGEQWIQAIEKELEALRLERREVAGRLAAAEAERDLYRAFARTWWPPWLRGGWRGALSEWFRWGKIRRASTQWCRLWSGRAPL